MRKWVILGFCCFVAAISIFLPMVGPAGWVVAGMLYFQQEQEKGSP